MTVAAATPSIEYAGNGSTVNFAAPWRFLAGADLRVSVVDASDVETVKTITTHYTVAGGTTDAGGTVTMLAAPASGTRLRIRRRTPRTQPTDYQTADTFPAETHEQGLDRAMMAAQEADAEIARVEGLAVRLPAGEEAVAVLPARDVRKGNYLFFNAITGAPEPKTPDDFEAPSAASAAEAAASALAAAASASSAATSEDNAQLYETAAAAGGTQALVARNEAEGFRDEAEGFRDEAEGFKDDAEAAAATAFKATSATSLSVATGSKVWVLAAPASFVVGQQLKSTSRANPTSYMAGIVTAYAHPNLTINVSTTGTGGGAGPFTDWDIGLQVGGSVTIPDVVGLTAALAGKADDAATTSALGGKQASHANLTAFSGLTLVADRLPYANGAGTLALATFSAAGRALVDDASSDAQLTTLGGTTIGANIFKLANPGAITFPRFNADNTVTARSATNMRSDLGLGTAATMTGPSGTIVGTSDTQTLTNKRIDHRAVSAGSSSGTLTPNADTTDIFLATGLTGGITMAVPSGTPTNGQIMQDRIKDNGTSRSISWNAIYRAIGVTLPSATTVSKYLYVTREYNSADSKWDVLAVALEA